MEQKFERVIVMGAGGVGWWLVTALMRDTKGAQVEVWDSDTFQGGMGAGRLPIQEDPTTYKVWALEGWVEMSMGDRGPKVRASKLHPWNVVWGPETLLVDCTDMELSVRRTIWQEARRRGVQLLRVSYDGNGVVVVARGLPLSDRPGGGYALVPSMAQAIAAGGLGAMAVHLLLEGREVGEIAIKLPIMEVPDIPPTNPYEVAFNAPIPFLNHLSEDDGAQHPYTGDPHV